MAMEHSSGMLSCGSGDVTEAAHELEGLVQRLLMAEQSVFTEETASFGLTVPQYVTLSAIEAFDEGRERMGRIAAMAHQCSATMTGIVDRLESMSLVQRVNNPNDRRSVLVELTEDGRRRLDEVRAMRRRRLEAVLSRLDADSRSEMCAALLHFTEALEQSK